MKIIRLNVTDARNWRQNQTVLVGEGGKFVRNATFEELRALADVEKKSRHLRQPVRMEIGSADGTKIEIIATPKPISRETMIITSTIGGLDVVSGREHFKNQVLAIHGECQLRTHTGQFMCSVRDPSVQRPSPKDASRNSPKPEHCQCKGWGNPHAGRHHNICEWNMKAPPEERALPEDGGVQNVPSMTSVITKVDKPSILDMPVAPPRPIADPYANATMTMMRAPEKPSVLLGSPVFSPEPIRQAPVLQAAAAAVPAPVNPGIPSPGQCVCQKWDPTPASEPGKHHPICEWKEPWEAFKGGNKMMMLVNLSTGEVSRRATEDEIRIAAGEKGFILIGEDQYGVVPEAEAGKTVAA